VALDVASVAGRNFPLVEAAIGYVGRLIGIDLTLVASGKAD